MTRRVGFALILGLAVAWPCGHDSEAGQRKVEGGMDNAITITAGGTTFSATLVDSPTTAAFKRLLPLSVRMSELNGNEKLFRLPSELPTNASQPRSITIGDVMLYGSNTIVVFYKSFPTPYSYTRLGQIDDARGLEAALGGGSVDVAFRSK